MHLEERVVRLRPVHNAAGNRLAAPLLNEGRLADPVLVEHLAGPVLGLHLAGPVLVEHLAGPVLVEHLAGLVPKGHLVAPPDPI